MYSPKYVLYNMLFYKNINHLLINVKQPDYMNHISQNLQAILSYNKEVSVINTYYTSDKEFILSKPFISENNTVFTFSYMNLTKSNEFFSHYWWFKLKSSESFKKNKIQNIGQKLNKHIFEEAFNKLSSYQQNEYNQYGKKLIFGEDIVIFAEKKYDALKWISNKLDIDNTKSNIVIRSPIMYTNINAIPEKVAGMTYVKTISPYQVIEWVTNKSFQKNPNGI